MPRAPKWPPVPHVHRASGRERVTYRGKHYYLGPAGSREAKAEYARLLARLAREEGQPDPAAAPPAPAAARRRDGRPPPAVSPRERTVAEVLAGWEEWAAGPGGPSPAERDEYRRSLEVVAGLFAALPAAQFTVARLDAARAEMVKRGWSRGVVNRRVLRVKTCWRWAERHELVPAGAWAHLRSLEALRPGARGVRSTPRRQAAGWADLAKVCRRVRPAVRGMLLFGWYTGCRPSEARLLRAGDVRRTGELWEYAPEGHKNEWRGQDRLVLIGPRCQALLARFLAGKEPGDYVFSADEGGKRAYTRRTYGQAVARACKKAGVKVVPYQTRHAAKQRARRELGLDHARSLLGQSSLQTTDRYDAGQDRRLAEEAARRVG